MNVILLVFPKNSIYTITYSFGKLCCTIKHNMKNTQKGFIIPLLIAIIAVLAIGGGVYVYEQSKTTPTEQQPVVNNPQTTNTTQVTTTQNNTQTTSTQSNLTINVDSPKSGDVFHIGQITGVQWGTYPFKNGDNSIFDITEINSDGQNLIASVAPSQVGCNGHQAAACSYAWTPTKASQKDKILVSERGTNNLGYSGTFSVVSPAILKPSITSINPSQGGTNSTVTIYGSNLLKSNAVIFSLNGQPVASNIGSDITSSDQTHITFNTSSIRVAPGTYQVSVLTAAGYSNFVSFTIQTVPSI